MFYPKSELKNGLNGASDLVMMIFSSIMIPRITKNEMVAGQFRWSGLAAVIIFDGKAYLSF